MAGPEDSTTTTNNTSSQKRSQANNNISDGNDDVFIDLDNNITEDQWMDVDNLKPRRPTSVEMADDVRSDDDGRLSGVGFKKVRYGGLKTSQCSDDQQDCDVFDVSSKPSHFYMLADDEDDDNGHLAVGDFGDFDNEEEEEEGVGYSDRRTASPLNRGSASSGETRSPAEVQEDFVSEESHGDVFASSSPRSVSPFHRANTSGLVTTCRHSSTQLAVRCQVNNPEMRVARSCPAAFSPLWTNVVPRGSATRPGGDSAGTTGAVAAAGRRRRNTVAYRTELRRRRFQTHQDDPTHPDFQGRGRSYSESDVQRLLMKEVGQELRRISDEFHFSRTKGKLTTVSESASEEDFGGSEV